MRRGFSLTLEDREGVQTRHFYPYTHMRSRRHAASQVATKIDFEREKNGRIPVRLEQVEVPEANNEDSA